MQLWQSAEVDDAKTKELSNKLTKTLKLLPGANILPQMMAAYLQKGGSFFADNEDYATDAEISETQKNQISETPKVPPPLKPRDVFIKEYRALVPYYADFRDTQGTEARIFKDSSSLTEVAKLIKRLSAFGNSQAVPWWAQANTNLQVAIEKFDSSLMTGFERAYDAQNVEDMQVNAEASFYLNGGRTCAQLFISKNPIFFDEAHNPSLVASKIPSLISAQAVGKALSEDFATFMKHMLGSCKTQSEIIYKVFPPQMNVAYHFIHRLFEESIADYLSAVLEQAKKQDTQTYIHTLATAIFHCTQFLEFLFLKDDMPPEFDKIRDTVSEICAPYAEGYIELEMEQLRFSYKGESDRWTIKVRWCFMYLQSSIEESGVTGADALLTRTVELTLMLILHVSTRANLL